MTPHVRLVLAVHDHQPIGNFDNVFEENYQLSYHPFLEMMEEFYDIPICLHTSGSLLEWLVDHKPEYLERLKALVKRGQVEVLGGPFYEPILACIPRKDRIGQIQTYKDYLQRLFDQQIRGMWMPERVWEQSFASNIVEGGIEYSIVDDFHFKCAGLTEDQLHGYYLTEDDGRLLKMFPVAERMRYIVPFGEPQEAIDYLREIGNLKPGTIVSFGDDGEKFGSWPGTQEHVYKNGWLRRFFTILRENSDWIKVTTMADAVDEVSPMGRCYLPDASYREMTEWALNTPSQIEFQDLVKQQEHTESWNTVRRYMRGASWRNFLVKYAENNEMYCRMWEVSRRLEEISNSDLEPVDVAKFHEARTNLYRAQCNCPYWHGAFGGLYLPHLRNAIYKHLIMADTILDEITHKEKQWVSVGTDDFNFDARKEVKLSGHRLNAYFSPANGGHLYELDLKVPKHNLLATLNRRPEPYHRKILEFAEQAGQGDGELVKVLHENITFKQPDLHLRVAYDSWPRKSLVDHFLSPETTLEQFQKCEGTIGKFHEGVYQSRLKRNDNEIELTMSRQGVLGEHVINLSKRICLNASKGSTIDVTYELTDLPEGIPLHFAVEWNFAGMAAGAEDRYFYNSNGAQCGQLETVHDWHDETRIGLVDEWLGIDASLEMSAPTSIWTFPIETVSQSEGGFELVHQSTTVIPHWQITADSKKSWSINMKFLVDVSMIEARILREAAVSAI